jgi:hypothetical protein
VSSIYLGNINGGEVRCEMAQSVVKAATSGVISFVWLKQSPPYLDIHRNVIVEHFLNQTDLDKLLFVDSDIEFTVDDIVALDEADLDVVSGWYRNPDEKGQLHPVVYGWGPRKESNGRHTSTVQIETDEDLMDLPEVKPQIAQVTAAGTGFVMLTRNMLADMGDLYGLPQPWFVEQAVIGKPGEDPVWHGEDLMFGLRASKMGRPWHVHKGVHLPHRKTGKF